MVQTTEIACNVFQECIVSIAGHFRRSILSVTKVVTSRLLVRFVGLAYTGHERVVVGPSVVGVVVCERVEPWGSTWWASLLSWIVPRMTEFGDRVVLAAHVELRCVATVLVVVRVDFRRLWVDATRVWIAVGSPDICALTADLSAVVVDRLRRSNLGRGQRSVVGPRTVRSIVCIHYPCVQVLVGSVVGVIFANESYFVPRLDQGSFYVNIIPLVVRHIDLVVVLIVQRDEDRWWRRWRGRWRRW